MTHDVEFAQLQIFNGFFMHRVGWFCYNENDGMMPD